MAKLKNKQASKETTKKTKTIDENTTLADVMAINGGEKVLEKFNFPCLHCAMAAHEIDFLKIGDVCRMYGIDLEEVLKELRKLK